MTKLNMVKIPEFTIEEAQQTVYNLDEIINVLQVSLAKHEVDPKFQDDISDILDNVQSARNKVHVGLLEHDQSISYVVN